MSTRNTIPCRRRCAARLGLAAAIWAVLAAALCWPCPAACGISYGGRLAAEADVAAARRHLVLWARKAGAMLDDDVGKSRDGVRVILHPAAEGIVFAFDPERDFEGSAQTSDLGPGYHQAVIALLDDFKTGCAQAMRVRDDTGYWEHRDRSRLEARMVQEARETLESALARWGNDPMARMVTPLGEFDKRSVERWRDALVKLDGLAGWFVWWGEKPDGAYWTNLGCAVYFGCFMRGGHPPDAVVLLRKAESYLARGRAMGCRTWLSYYYQGRIERDRGRLDAAAAWFGEALKLNSDQPDVLYALGGALLAANKPDEAERVYMILSVVAPRSAEVQFRLGLSRCARGAYETGLRALDMAVVFDPTLAAAWAERGLALREMGRLDEALASLKKSLVLAPNDARALYNLGVTLSCMNQAAEAEEALGRSVKLDPKHYDAWIELGIAQMGQDKMETARQTFLGATRLEPRRWEAFYNLGKLYEHLKREAEANASYREAQRRGAPR